MYVKKVKRWSSP